MYDIQKGDLIITIKGDILKVRRASKNWIYGVDIIRDDYFLLNRVKLEKIIKEVFYV